MCIYFTYNEYSISNDVDLIYDKDGFIVKEGESKEEGRYKCSSCFENTDKLFLMMNEEGSTEQELQVQVQRKG